MRKSIFIKIIPCDYKLYQCAQKTKKSVKVGPRIRQKMCEQESVGEDNVGSVMKRYVSFGTSLSSETMKVFDKNNSGFAILVDAFLAALEVDVMGKWYRIPNSSFGFHFDMLSVACSEINRFVGIDDILLIEYKDIHDFVQSTLFRLRQSRRDEFNMMDTEFAKKLYGLIEPRNKFSLRTHGLTVIFAIAKSVYHSIERMPEISDQYLAATFLKTMLIMETKMPYMTQDTTWELLTSAKYAAFVYNHLMYGIERYKDAIPGFDEIFRELKSGSIMSANSISWLVDLMAIGFSTTKMIPRVIRDKIEANTDSLTGTTDMKGLVKSFASTELERTKEMLEKKDRECERLKRELDALKKGGGQSCFSCLKTDDEKLKESVERYVMRPTKVSFCRMDIGKWRPHNILAIDGGGIKGAAAVRLLMGIFNTKHEMSISGEIKNMDCIKIGDDRKSEYLAPHQVFDLVCGTSTGSFVAYWIAIKRSPLSELLEKYSELAQKVFPKSEKTEEEKRKSQQSDADELWEDIKSVAATIMTKFDGGSFESSLSYLYNVTEYGAIFVKFMKLLATCVNIIEELSRVKTTAESWWSNILQKLGRVASSALDTKVGKVCEFLIKKIPQPLKTLIGNYGMRFIGATTKGVITYAAGVVGIPTISNYVFVKAPEIALSYETVKKSIWEFIVRIAGNETNAEDIINGKIETLGNIDTIVKNLMMEIFNALGIIDIFKIMKVKPKWDADALRSQLIEITGDGEKTTLCDPSRVFTRKEEAEDHFNPNRIPMFFCTALDAMNSCRQILFTNYSYNGSPCDSPQGGDSSGIQRTSSIYSWQALRASSAAPTFFDPFVMNKDIWGNIYGYVKRKYDNVGPVDVTRGVYVDGGVGANNPTYLGLLEASRCYKAENIGLIVSLGVGDDGLQVQPAGLTRIAPDLGTQEVSSSTSKTVQKPIGFITRGTVLTDIITSITDVATGTGSVVDLMNSMSASLPMAKFVRISTTYGKIVPMDSAEDVAYVIQIAKDTVESDFKKDELEFARRALATKNVKDWIKVTESWETTKSQKKDL